MVGCAILLSFDLGFQWRRQTFPGGVFNGGVAGGWRDCWRPIPGVWRSTGCLFGPLPVRLVFERLLSVIPAPLLFCCDRLAWVGPVPARAGIPGSKHSQHGVPHSPTLPPCIPGHSILGCCLMMLVLMVCVICCLHLLSPACCLLACLLCDDLLDSGGDSGLLVGGFQVAVLLLANRTYLPAAAGGGWRSGGGVLWRGGGWRVWILWKALIYLIYILLCSYISGCKNIISYT